MSRLLLSIALALCVSVNTAFADEAKAKQDKPAKPAVSTCQAKTGCSACQAKPGAACEKSKKKDGVKKDRQEGRAKKDAVRRTP